MFLLSIWEAFTVGFVVKCCWANLWGGKWSKEREMPKSKKKKWQREKLNLFLLPMCFEVQKQEKLVCVEKFDKKSVAVPKCQ
jgi:hypothetical protein